jgi:hypothetical protein
MKPIPLAGFVTWHDLHPALAAITSQASLQPRTRFMLDCAAVTGFSKKALAELVKLRFSLRGAGGDLLLTRCGAAVTASLVDPPLLNLVSKPSTRKDSESGERKQPYFLSLHGTRYQRFWMN